MSTTIYRLFSIAHFFGGAYFANLHNQIRVLLSTLAPETTPLPPSLPLSPPFTRLGTRHGFKRPLGKYGMDAGTYALSGFGSSCGQSWVVYWQNDNDDKSFPIWPTRKHLPHHNLAGRTLEESQHYKPNTFPLARGSPPYLSIYINMLLYTNYL